MDALIKAECWEYLNDRFGELTLQVWRHDFNILLAYANATLPAKSKISNRKCLLINVKNCILKEFGVY